MSSGAKMSLSPMWTAPLAASDSPFLDPPAETSTLIALFSASNFSFAALTSGWSALDPLTRTVCLPSGALGWAALVVAAPFGLSAAGGGVLSHAATARNVVAMNAKNVVVVDISHISL